jgi:DNA-binding response OmpR family regulator
MAKILIIDDDLQVGRMVGEFLRRHGHEIATAANGRLGLTAAAAGRPDLILCDLDMPGLNGQEVVAALRQDERLGDTPIIFLSGCTERGQVRRSMNVGGDDFITKPAALPEILEAVNARLDRRQKQRKQLDRQLDRAAEYFVGVIHDLNQRAPEVRWLAEIATEKSAQQNQIIQRVRKSLDAANSSSAVPRPPSTFLVKSHNRQHFVKLSEVKALLANGEYSMVHWGTDEHMMFRKSLKQWQAELPAELFVRVHRQAIINLSFLDFVERDAEGKPHVHLREFKPVIEVSQRARPGFNRSLKKFKAR